MTKASRAQVDLDAFARDLRQEGHRAPQPGAKADPLAELARIVGQDDPFRALLAARDEIRAGSGAAPAQPAWNARVEPSFAPEAIKPVPADAFDQYLASVDRDTHQEDGAYATAAGAAQAEADDFADARELRRVSPRRRLVSVGAGIAVVAVAVTGALTYKSLNGGGAGHGGVPVVQADSTPLKVAPKVADGVEIPDQNRQIYDPKGKKDGQIKIVNREEQPLDVAEAARAAQGPSPAGSAQGGTTPGNGPFEAFGEPRRVRTVAVKPDAPPAPPVREAQADAGPSPIPTMVLPTDEPAKPAPSGPSTRQAAASQTSTTPAPVVPPPAAVPAEPAAPRTVATKPPPKAVQRVATVAPAAAVSPDTTASTATSDDAIVRTGPVSGFSVQLGVRNSAAEAKAALRQMQAKYAQLAGKPELIRQAEVNGKTLYRVRVGPLDKAEAASLCSALQGAGGQCFVAKN